jgi:hypothetical protein
MGDANWERLQEKLRNAKTPEQRRDAADAMARYIPPEHQNKSMVTMSRSGVNVVRLGDLSREMANNPSVFERVRRIIGGRK